MEDGERTMTITTDTRSTTFTYNPTTNSTGGYVDCSYTYPTTFGRSVVQLDADSISVNFTLSDGTRKTLTLKKYMEFAIRNKMMPEDCKDEVEFNKILNEMRAVEEL